MTGISKEGDVPYALKSIFGNITQSDPLIFTVKELMYVLLHNKGDLLTHKQSAQGNLDSILLFEKQNVKNTGPDSIL